MIKFITGKSYESRSLCDYKCIFKMNVIRRTEKTITIQMYGVGTKTVKIHESNDAEYVYPMGQYSMAPRFNAV